jgi:tetratricopeptide (TPR) repeat protein
MHACLLLVALMLFVHGRALTFGFTGTDDTLQVVDDAAFLADVRNAPRAFGRGLFAVGGAEGYYRPVVTLSNMLDAQWAGPKPFAYHATNLVLHGLTVVSLFFIGRRLGFARDVTVAMVAVFAVHPSNAEAVSWLPARGDDLLGVWLTGATLAWLRFRETRHAGPLAAHLGLLLLALFTKENAIVLPAVFVLYGLLVDEDRTWMRDRRLWIGWVAALVVWLLAWRAVMSEVLKNAPGLGAAFKNLPVLVLCLGRALDPFHPSVLATAVDTSYVPGLLALIGVAAGAWWLRGRRRALLLWGLMTFFLLLAPALPVADFLMLEHRLYAPWLGLVVAGLALLQTLAESGERGRRVVRGGMAAVVAALALLAFGYASAFKDAESFTAQAVRSSPRSSLARLSRGVVLQTGGRLPEAQAEYEEALRLNPKQLRANANLGAIRHQQGAAAEAEQLFRRELEINPRDGLASHNLASVLVRQGRREEARRVLEQALRVDPGNTRARQALAALAAPVK